MAVKKLRINVPSRDLDIFPNQWNFALHENMEQEKDEQGRLIYIAQASGRRMIRLEDGKFLALDGQPLTEADLAEGFLTPTVKKRRLALQMNLPAIDRNARVEDLKEALTKAQFGQLVTALKAISQIMLVKQQEATEGSELVDDPDNGLDKLIEGEPIA